MTASRSWVPRFSRIAIELELKALERHPNGVLAQWPGVMRVVMNAIATDMWTDDDESCLAGLRQEAERHHLFEPDDNPPPLKVHARAFTAMLLALGNSLRLQPKFNGPWPEDQPSAAEISAVIAENEMALTLAKARGLDPQVARIASVLHMECALLLMKLAGITGKTPDLVTRISAHVDQVPDDLGRQVPFIGDFKVMFKLFTRDLDPLDEAVVMAGDQDRNVWDAGGADYARGEAAAYRADESGSPQDYRAAIAELQMVWIGLPTGSEARGRTLTMLADMQLGLAASTSDMALLPDAIPTAVTALRVAATPRVAAMAACTMTDCLSMMAAVGQFHGPFEEVAGELRRALDRLDPAGPVERAALLAATAAALGMQATALEDVPLRQAARKLAEAAEEALPPAAPSATAQQAEWVHLYRTAQGLLLWTAAQVLARGDTEMIPLALRVAAKHERYLADGGTAKERKRLALILKRLRRAEYWTARGRPLDTVRKKPKMQPPGPAAISWTTRPGHPLSPQEVRRLARHGPDGLRSAIARLNQALVTDAFTLPTTQRAGLLDLLAQCYHESGRRDGDARTRHRAERAARAALRELAGCVLIAPGMTDALPVAARASEIAARSIGWCLADGRHRVAVELAEAGRALVLASVTMAGRAEELLRAAGNDMAAAAWRKDTEADRAIALDALWDTPGGATLLAPATDLKVAGAIFGTPLDAVIYLVPPQEAGDGLAGLRAAGHGVLVRPGVPEVEVVPLPGLTAIEGTPLAGYLTALERTLADYRPGAGGGAGFRGLPEGPAWVSALDELGRWAYDAIMGPLIAHTRGWQLDDLPRLALIPLGKLGAIPFAAAWTPVPDGTRRYAIDDVVLSYAASARLLGAAGQRPRQRLDERVVFVTDPTGTLHFSRTITPGTASRLYPSAEVYGMKNAPNGPATTAVLLGALPGDNQPGASLLHLATHGRVDPEPAVQAYDNWLPLARILRQARGRAPDAPGGLVITSACLTDVTLADYDESLTMATAFLAAGATAVIGTRWPVDDDTTLALAIRLHQHLKDGNTPAEALRRAQLDLLRPGPEVRESLGPRLAAIADSRLRHPASWAGHVHHGI